MNKRLSAAAIFVMAIGLTSVVGGCSRDQIESQVEINAEPAVVWTVLMDFACYPEWNPFIRRISGEQVVGAAIDVDIQPIDFDSPMKFTPTVLAVDTDREFRWVGQLLMPGVFDGEHYFIIEPKSDGVVLRHGEKFFGLLVPVMGVENFLKSFDAMNIALKERAESAPERRRCATENVVG